MENTLKESIALRETLLADSKFAEAFQKTLDMVRGCLLGGSTLFIAGNGGSAADAQHFAAELVGRYKKERKGYPAIALTTDSSFLTAWSNDYSFDTVFARQIEALGKKGDVFMGISTSGHSKNIIEATATAHDKGLHTGCLLGRDGGALKGACDVELIVPSQSTARIQEIHITVIHALCEALDESLK